MDKLIRDKMPELYGLGAKVRYPYTSIEYLKLLSYKLVEESNEVYNAAVDYLYSGDADYIKTKAHLMEELADVLEVYETIMRKFNINKKDIELLKEEKATVRGGFERGYILKTEDK